MIGVRALTSGLKAVRYASWLVAPSTRLAVAACGMLAVRRVSVMLEMTVTAPFWFGSVPATLPALIWASPASTMEPWSFTMPGTP